MTARLLIVSWLVGVGAVLSAQQAPDKQELNRMMDAIRAAIRTDDWTEASRLAIRLNATLLEWRTKARASPALEMQHLEMLAGKDSISRNPLLPRMTKAAFAAGDWARAERYANEALEAATHGVFWWTGDAIHQGNIVLGRLAMRRLDLEQAKRFLLAAGKTPGSSSLESLGPNMALAQELLDRGESAVVLEYLKESGEFWHANRGKLAEWTVLIRAGLKPDFGANLTY